MLLAVQSEQIRRLMHSTFHFLCSMNLVPFLLTKIERWAELQTNEKEGKPCHRCE